VRQAVATDNKPKKKPKQKPQGWEQWSPNRRAIYKAGSYSKRLRALVRSAGSNMEDGYVLALRGDTISDPGERQELTALQAECHALCRSMPGVMEMIRDIARSQDSELTAA
jgi:hypothetical protein